MMNFFFEFIALLENYFTAKYQAKWFNANMSTGKKFNHTPWAVAYGAMVGIAVLLDLIVLKAGLINSILTGVGMILTRAVSFNFILNRSRTPKKPWFYINATPTTAEKDKGSVDDKIELAITGNGKWYPIVWGIYAILFILVQLKLIF